MQKYVQKVRGKNDEWETPPNLFEDLDREFGFDLDACATDENHKCDKYYTIEDNGLTKNWGGVLRVVQSTIQQDKTLDEEVL